MKLLKHGLTALCAALIAGTVFAQPYPSKTIRYIVAFPPGGGADVLSRILAPKLSEALGQQVVIDNRGGATGNIGAEIAARSPRDGYTILFAYAGTHAINPSIYSKMPFKESDFAPIIWLSEVPQVLVVHPSLPVKTVKDLIALAKSKPDELTYGSSGSGAMNHLTAELFKLMTGTKMIHVPYKGGGPLAIALLSGEVSLMLGEPASVVQQVKAGKLRAIAVTSAKRALAMPELPTVAESGVPGYEYSTWYGLLSPAGVPRAIVNRLNKETVAALNDPEIRQRYIAQGVEPIPSTAAHFAAYLKSETAKWTKVVRAAKIPLQ